MIYIVYLFAALVVFIAVKNGIRIGWRKYVLNLFIGLDQIANALLGGMPDETISSRCARGRNKWYWKWLARILDWLDPDHCLDALASEKNLLHMPDQLRK